MFRLFDKLLIFFTLLLAIFVGYVYTVSFEDIVDVQSIKYHDVCVGDTIQNVTALRFVDKPVKGTTFGEVFFYNGNIKSETIIKREINYIYQVNTEPITYEVKWSQPFLRPGLYGASDFIIIEPWPFITKEKYFSEDDQKFNVIDCKI